MKEIKTKNYEKIAGKDKKEKRDGTGPYKDSLQNKKKNKGKRKQQEDKCLHSLDIHCDGIDDGY